jgi:hypothetical protein
MAKPDPDKTREPAPRPEPQDHTSDMVLAQQRAAEEHRAQSARMASFRQRGQAAGRG